MASILRPHVNKIPGMPRAKEDSRIKDLTKLSRVELLDLKAREAKLLANKANLNRLPDKGERIKTFYAKVEAELERRTNIDEAAVLFSELNIAAKGQQTLNELEWHGRLHGNTEEDDPTHDVLDSDDEADMDPLRILAQGSMHERRMQVLPPEPQLITAADLAEIESFKSDASDCGVAAKANNGLSDNPMDSAEAVIDVEIVAIDVGEKLQQLKPKLQQIIEKSPSSKASSVTSDSHCSKLALQEVDQHVRYLMEKTEVQPVSQREKFKPYRTTISNVHDPAKERARKQGYHWEVTAATPPPIQHNGAKLLPLLDSVELQASYLVKLKELHDKQVAERLTARLERLENRQLQLPNAEELKRNTAFTAYRLPRNNIEGEPRFNDVDEVLDPLDEEKVGGGVTYTVFD